MPECNRTTADSEVSYAVLRKAGRTLIPKIYANPVSKQYDMMKAARKLTLPVVGRTFVFDGETEMNALADFWIHEFRQGGTTMIERCRPEEMDLTPFEGEVLRAHQQTRTSLFEVIETLPRSSEVRLRDLLEPHRAEVRLTDVGLSESLTRLARPLLLFFRLVTVRGFEMTSGVNFTFSSERKAFLLHTYAERMKRVMPSEWAERKFVFFYRKHREIGEQEHYQEPPGTV